MLVDVSTPSLPKLLPTDFENEIDPKEAVAVLVDQAAWRLDGGVLGETFTVDLLLPEAPDYRVRMLPAAAPETTPDLPPNQVHAPRVSRAARNTVCVLIVWMVVVTGLVTVATFGNPVARAIMGMAWGLMLLWLGVCGLAMRRWRRQLCAWMQRIPLPWGARFVALCTLLALVEEAITTGMTNTAPLYGLRLGQAYITASANYFDVVLYHSVVVFVPMFMGWAFMLRRWRFPPFAVFLCFGLTGTLAETLSFGLQNLGNAGFWILVYGLMVWLPACAVNENADARRPAWWHYPLAVFLPFLFVPLAAVLAPWLWLTARHPSIHFGPLPHV